MRRTRIGRLGPLLLALALVFAVSVGVAQRAGASAQAPNDWSFYVNQNDGPKLEQLGCNQSNYDNAVNSNSLVVLDFGGYNSDGSAQDAWGAGWLSQSTIEYLADSFVQGYYSCGPPHHILILSVAGNNSIDMNYNVGVNSAHTEEAVLSYSKLFNNPFTGGGEDIETWIPCQGCTNPNVTSAMSYNWFNGYNAAGGNAYVNFGSADECPTSGGWAYCSNTGWNSGDYYNFSQGWWQSGVTPETYSYNDAAQWNWIRNVTNGARGQIAPLGPMNTTIGLNPGQAWSALNAYFATLWYSLQVQFESTVCGKGPFHPNGC